MRPNGDHRRSFCVVAYEWAISSRGSFPLASPRRIIESLLCSTMRQIRIYRMASSCSYSAWGDKFHKKLTMKMFKVLVVLGLFLAAISTATPEVTVFCMMVYDDGGAPAVYESPECPKWNPSHRSQNQTRNCQFAMLQGHREYQEDRITCDLDMKIPFLGKDGLQEVSVGIAAVFDGHGGKETSEMASDKLLDYFFLHIVFNIYKQVSLKNFNQINIPDEGPPISDDELMHEILKNALLRTIHDIDAEFSQEAFSTGSYAGSTATIVLLADSQILVANIGDSKALLCSKKIKSPLRAEGTSTEFDVEELTRDHHPDRDDEKDRIKAAGGFVCTRGVPRVNCILAVSRSIGDVYLKRYGVSPVPEVLGWQNLTARNSYLVVASDGIFESLSPQNVCDLLLVANTTLSSSLAHCLVQKAFKKGSGDNLSAIVIPLNFSGSSS